MTRHGVLQVFTVYNWGRVFGLYHVLEDPRIQKTEVRG